MAIDNFIFDVEQTAQAILNQKGVESHSARSMRVPVEAIKAMLSELHGIRRLEENDILIQTQVQALPKFRQIPSRKYLHRISFLPNTLENTNICNLGCLLETVFSISTIISFFFLFLAKIARDQHKLRFLGVFQVAIGFLFCYLNILQPPKQFSFEIYKKIQTLFISLWWILEPYPRDPLQI